MAPQAFPVTGVEGFDGAVGVVGVEPERPPPQADAVITAIAEMATTARARAVLTSIRKRAFLSDHAGWQPVVHVRLHPTGAEHLMTRRLYECSAPQASTSSTDRLRPALAGLDA